MATKKQALVLALAQSRRKRSESASKPLVAPKPHKPAPERDTPTDGQRELAKACAVDAMVMGWDQAVQKHAYENRIPEPEMRKILDEALEYNDKADPSGRIDELNDWANEKRGSSFLASPRR